MPDAPFENEILSIHSPDSGLTLEFYPSGGGCITSFQRRTDGECLDLFRRWNGSRPFLPVQTASFPMTPVSNRIADCQLRFEDETLAIGPAFGEEPNYLHGDGWCTAWEATSLGPHQATLRLRKESSVLSPYDYEAEQRFILEDGVLHLDIAVTNRGRRLPFGTGHHPFFPRTATTKVRANLPKVWLCDHNMHPTELINIPERWNFARGVVMADQALLPPSQGFRGFDLMDNCFPGWDGKAEILQPDHGIKIVVTADPVFRTMVIYNPSLDRDFFVLEAVSNVIDGFNQLSRGVPDTGTVILDQGEILKGRTSFTVLPL